MSVTCIPWYLYYTQVRTGTPSTMLLPYARSQRTLDKPQKGGNNSQTKADFQLEKQLETLSKVPPRPPKERLAPREAWLKPRPCAAHRGATYPGRSWIGTSPGGQDANAGEGSVSAVRPAARCVYSERTGGSRRRRGRADGLPTPLLEAGARMTDRNSPATF
jgi:hypothetical protein